MKKIKISLPLGFVSQISVPCGFECFNIRTVFVLDLKKVIGYFLSTISNERFLLRRLLWIARETFLKMSQCLMVSVPLPLLVSFPQVTEVAVEDIRPRPQGSSPVYEYPIEEDYLKAR